MATGTALGKINVTSNLKALEREAIDSFRALEKAEKTFEPGLRFGQALIDLRKSAGIKHGEWMPTLQRLAHARKVRLIGESRKKDDRLDAQTLARLARIDPQLLSSQTNAVNSGRFLSRNLDFPTASID